MALTERLALLVTLDAKGAIQGFEKVGKSADKNLSKAEQRMDKFGLGLQKAGAAMAAGGGLLAVGLFKAAQASEEANLAVVKLDNSLKNNPKLAGESSKAYIELADAIQGKTAADGDAIVAGQAMLATFKVTGEQIKNLTPLVVDYARKFGVDLVTANASVGKALDGNVGALKRNGVSIDEVLFKTDRYAAVQKALAEQVGGFAEAEGKTFAGSLERLKNQLGDLEESVGKGAVDGFTSMFSVIGGGVDELNSINPKILELSGKLAAFGSVGLIAGGGLLFVVGKVIELRKQLRALGPAAGSFAGIGAAVAGLATAWVLYTDAIKSAEAAGKSQVDQLRSDFAGLDPAKTTMEDLSSIIQGLNGDITDLAETKRGSNAPWDADFRANLSASIDEAKKFRGEIVDQQAAAKKLAAEMGVTEDEALRLVLANKEVAAAAGVAGGEFDGEAAAAAGLTQQLDELSNALRAQFDPLFAAQDAHIKLAEAQKAVTEAVKDHGAKSPEAAAANRDLARAALDYEGSLIQLESAVAAGEVSQADYTATLERWVQQGYITRDAANQAAYSFGELRGQAEKVPGRVSTTVTTPGLDTAIDGVSRLIGKLGLLQGTYVANIEGGGILYGGERAAGGPVAAGKTYMVGESGPELLTMGSRSGTIIPNGALASMSATAPTGGGWGNSYSITVNSLDPKAAGKVVVEAIQSFESSNGKGWRAG